MKREHVKPKGWKNRLKQIYIFSSLYSHLTLLRETLLEILTFVRVLILQRYQLSSPIINRYTWSVVRSYHRSHVGWHFGLLYPRIRTSDDAISSSKDGSYHVRTSSCLSKRIAVLHVDHWDHYNYVHVHSVFQRVHLFSFIVIRISQQYWHPFHQKLGFIRWKNKFLLSPK